MIALKTPLGSISMTSDYFAELVSYAARSCYGVAGMATGGHADDLKSLVFGHDFPEKGVRVTQHDNQLTIELHIKVAYGLNIASMVQSIAHKVKHEVENATGLSVARIEVSVDDIVAD
ncbi:Asp23/Gls24 family envelope stress response protein [uncultured Allofournierella sp.]|uniref:Asp23/Gls24 family envelope stress response protein n=1 Tax=uncultured Allofournierella sp. TaxID=1940258 RepID=UPI0037514AEF